MLILYYCCDIPPTLLCLLSYIYKSMCHCCHVTISKPLKFQLLLFDVNTKALGSNIDNGYYATILLGSSDKDRCVVCVKWAFHCAFSLSLFLALPRFYFTLFFVFFLLLCVELCLLGFAEKFLDFLILFFFHATFTFVICTVYGRMACSFSAALSTLLLFHRVNFQVTLSISFCYANIVLKMTIVIIIIRLIYSLYYHEERWNLRLLPLPREPQGGICRWSGNKKKSHKQETEGPG